jgi:UDP-N-acetylglucosamine--N-acetylmuramyl-(pentapeptide) pyrophosphoryl-undecaprenol N-acetylglucosamine transferase
MGKPALIQEQNGYAGISNKILARFAGKICVAYHGMDKFFPADKIVFTGNPVRGDIYPSAEKRTEALQYFGFSSDRPVLLVIGGSLGARTINKAVHGALEQFAEAGIQLLWQTGKPYADTASEAVKPYVDRGIKTMPFISRMDLAYPLADAVISRAGALSVSELCISGKPAILIPSPNVAEDHQTKNAMALVEKDAALIIKDHEAVERLAYAALSLLQDPELCHRLSGNILGLGKPNAAKDIAEEVLKLIK